jgi:hypothetical protein
MVKQFNHDANGSNIAQERRQEHINEALARLLLYNLTITQVQALMVEHIFQLYSNPQTKPYTYDYSEKHPPFVQKVMDATGLGAKRISYLRNNFDSVMAEKQKYPLGKGQKVEINQAVDTLLSYDLKFPEISYLMIDIVKETHRGDLTKTKKILGAGHKIIREYLGSKTEEQRKEIYDQDNTQKNIMNAINALLDRGNTVYEIKTLMAQTAYAAFHQAGIKSAAVGAAHSIGIKKSLLYKLCTDFNPAAELDKKDPIVTLLEYKLTFDEVQSLMIDTALEKYENNVPMVEKVLDLGKSSIYRYREKKNNPPSSPKPENE